MTNKTMPETAYRQFPMRLDASLADALDRYSEATNIPKTTISRIALTKFLNQLENSGARAVLQQVCKIY
jgi:predicted transcriptional regulator